jgi:hypothetical protein
VDDLLDGLERDYRLRDKWGIKVASNVKPVRDHFGSWRAVDVTSDAIGRYIEGLREKGYANAALADFMRERHFARHIRHMRQLYGERRTALVNAIEN